MALCQQQNCNVTLQCQNYDMPPASCDGSQSNIWGKGLILFNFLCHIVNIGWYSYSVCNHGGLLRQSFLAHNGQLFSGVCGTHDIVFAQTGLWNMFVLLVVEKIKWSSWRWGFGKGASNKWGLLPIVIGGVLPCEHPNPLTTEMAEHDKLNVMKIE